MKKILVLGGSYMQSFFVNYACRAGYFVHVLDMDPNCFLSSNKNIVFKSIDIKDVEKVKNYFLLNELEIIVSPVSEVGNITASIISNELNLLYNSEDTVKSTTNKVLMRSVLKMASFPGPQVYSLSDFVNSTDQGNNNLFPVFVKPSTSSASRGVTYVKNMDEFKNAIELARCYSKSDDDILIESVIDGEQYSIETISSRGKHFIVAIVKEVLSNPPFFMERKNIIDSGYNKYIYKKAFKFINDLLNALNVEYGPSHIEIKIDLNENIYLIEVASRSGMLRDRLIEAACGENYNELIIKSYFGEEIIEPKLPTTNAMLGLIAYPEDYETYKIAKKKGVIIDEYLQDVSFKEKPTKLTDVKGYFFITSDNVKYFNKFKIKS